MDPWTDEHRCHAMCSSSYIPAPGSPRKSSRKEAIAYGLARYTGPLLSSCSKAEPHGKAERAANNVQAMLGR